MIANSLTAGLRNVCRLRAFRPLHDLELHRISFLQGAVSISCDGGIVNEHIWTVIAPDEAVSFGIIEPLYSSLHCDSLLKRDVRDSLAIGVSRQGLGEENSRGVYQNEMPSQ
jgi:hypothetical protein